MVNHCLIIRAIAVAELFVTRTVRATKAEAIVAVVVIAIIASPSAGHQREAIRIAHDHRGIAVSYYSHSIK